MTLNEFLRRVAEQQAVRIERTINVPGPELLARMNQRPTPTVADLLAHPDQRQERRRYSYRHIVGSGLTRGAIDEWQSNHVDHVLPDDVRELLTVANGVHLWADVETGRSYFGILPLEEWRDVAVSRWAWLFDDRPTPQALVISYHENGDYLLVLETSPQCFVWWDPQNPLEPKRVGSTVEEFLDFWWAETAELDPARDDASTVLCN